MRPLPFVAALAAIASTAGSAGAQAPGATAPVRVSIEDAMRAAVRVSHPVAAARASAERARADVLAARSGYLPQVAASASYVRTLASEYDALFAAPDAAGVTTEGGALPELPFGNEHAWRAGVDVTQPIWDGGRTRASVAIAKGAREVAELDERGRSALAVLEVTEAYYGAALAGRVVAIGEASLALAERTLADAKLGFDQGATSEFDLVRAEVTRDQQRTALVRARADRDLAAARLRRLLGLPLDRPLELTSELAAGDAGALARTATGAGGEPATLPVAQARAQVEARGAQLGLARAERFPRLAAFTSLGVVNYPPDGWPGTDDWRRNWTVGVSLSLPLFTGFRTTAQIRGARADRRAAEAQLAEVTEQAALAALEARTAVQVADATRAASARSAQLARRAYQIAEVRYRQGVSTYLELADARLALDRAQIDEAGAARDLQVARVRVALQALLPLGAGATARAPAGLTATAAATTATPAPAAASTGAGANPAAGAGAIPGAAGAPTGGAPR